jgi:arabinogalactan endo-1,4-beta-galactosidase
MEDELMKFVKGVDISMLPELEQAGAVYRDKGEAQDLLCILKSYGINAVRLRLWNNPYDAVGRPYGGGTNDFAKTVVMAKRIRKAGMQFLLDIHYSDFWTDPGKQMKPKAWANLTGKALEDAVHNFTVRVLQKLCDQNLQPDMIQIGNELTSGFLWPEGKLGEEKQNFAGMSRLLQAGISAARACDPNMPVILHLDNGGNHELYRSWFDRAAKEELDFDIIGLSYYPYWHGTLTDLQQNLNDISVRYGKDVMIMETAYGFTEKTCDGAGIFSRELAETASYPPTPQGQADFLRDLMHVIQDVPQGHGRGFFYWEPAWLPLSGTTWASTAGRAYIGDHSSGGNSWCNQAVFDFNGNALPVLKTIRDF